MYVISACLLGENCKYNGGNNDCQAVHKLAESVHVVPVCPEVAGGLPIPRPPAELRNGPDERRGINREGADVTEAFARGARLEWERVQKEAEKLGEPIECAVLRKGSPPCGSGKIYDGTFTKKMISGDGVFAALLKENGIKVITEEEL